MFWARIRDGEAGSGKSRGSGCGRLTGGGKEFGKS